MKPRKSIDRIPIVNKEIAQKPNNNTNAITKPIRPDASTKEKPMNE